LDDITDLSVLALFTYGCPRVGDAKFAASFADSGVEHTRVTHYHDLVPHVPMDIIGYHHTAQEVWFNEDSTSFKICDGTGEDDCEWQREKRSEGGGGGEEVAKVPSGLTRGVRAACSNSCSPLSCNSIDDHMQYLQVDVGIAGC
jgi:hypothetical protein